MADEVGTSVPSDLKSLQQELSVLRKVVEKAVQNIEKLNEQQLQMDSLLIAEGHAKQPYAKGTRLEDRLCAEISSLSDRLENLEKSGSIGNSLLENEADGAKPHEVAQPDQSRQETRAETTQRPQVSAPLNGESLPLSSFLQQTGRASDPAVGKHQEERIAKIEALVEKMSGEVSELQKRASDVAHDADAMSFSEDQDGAPEMPAHSQSMMFRDTPIDFFYQFQENIWDIVVILGEPALGTAASICIAVNWLINMLVQLTLCFIINDIFTTTEITETDVTRMRHWRVFFGHSTKLMNEYTYEPYARSVCRGVGGIQMATSAVDLVHRIERYMPLTEAIYNSRDPLFGIMIPYTKDIGVLLSLCAVLIWTLEIITALMASRSKVSALFHTPSGASSRIVDVGSSRQVQRMSTVRKLLCLSSATIEFLILWLLGISGTFFIIRTLNLRDLLMNCSALVIVLDFDELIFAALVPERGAYLLRSLEALPRPQPPRCLGLSPFTYFAMTVIIGTMTGSVFILKQQASILEDVYHEICGGNLDFVASPDGSGIITAGFQPATDNTDHVSNTYIFKAIRQLVLNEAGDVVDHWLDYDDMSAASSGIDAGPWSLLPWVEAGVGSAMEFWNRNCADMLPLSKGEYAYAHHFLHVLQDASQNYDIRECIQVKKWCNEDSVPGVRVRQVCPATCGCNDPGPRLLLRGDNGCSPTCALLPEYNQSLWSRTCTDLEVESPYWLQYSESLLSYLSTWPDDGASNITAEALVIAENGCKVVSKAVEVTLLGVAWTDPCQVTSQKLKPFTHACPVSCNCRSDNQQPFCPPSCG